MCSCLFNMLCAQARLHEHTRTHTETHVHAYISMSTRRVSGNSSVSSSINCHPFSETESH